MAEDVKIKRLIFNTQWWADHDAERILAKREIGYETTVAGLRKKVGDGVKKWSELPYVTLSAADSGLGNVDNTSDANKPVSTAQAAALALKADKTALSETNLKVATIDKEVSDYRNTIAQINPNQEAKQSVTGYGTVSLPVNAANGQISASVKGHTATNLIENGDFSSGTAGWNAYLGSSLSASNNTLASTGTGSSSSIGTIKNTAIAITANKKWYFKGRVRVTDTNCTSLVLYIGGTTSGGGNLQTISTPVQNQWYPLSVVFNNSAGAVGNIRIIVYASYADATTASGKVMELKEVFAIDMGTDSSNPNYSLTADQMNAKYPTWFNGTKSTVSAGRIKSVNKNLFNKTATPIKVVGTAVTQLDTGVRVSLVGTGYPYYVIIPILPMRLVAGKTMTLSVNIAKSNTNDSAGALMAHTNPDGSFPTGGYDLGALLSASGTTTVTINSSFASSNEIFCLMLWSSRTSSAVAGQYNDYTSIQIAPESTATAYEPYTYTTQYFPDCGLLQSVGTAKDEVSFNQSLQRWEKIQRVSDIFTLLPAGMTEYIATPTYVDVIAFPKTLFTNSAEWTVNIDGKVRIDGMSETNAFLVDAVEHVGKFYTNTTQIRFIVAKGAYTGLTDAKSRFPSLVLTYQLSSEIRTPIDVTGTLIGYANGTIYFESVLPVAGIYTASGIAITNTAFPISSIEKIVKIDFKTGVETPVDVAQAVIAANKQSFTHPSLTANDIVFFTYYHPIAGTLPEIVATYYNSSIVTVGADGKYYIVKHTVAVDGTIGHSKTEVL